MKILFYENGGYQTFPIVDGMIDITKEEYSKLEKGELMWNGSKLVPYVAPPKSQEQIKQERIAEIKPRLNQLSEDIVQHQAGEIVPDYPQRLEEFRTLHNELRELEGKKPRQKQIQI